MVFPLQLLQKGAGFPLQTVALCLLLHLPGKEEIGPVDIGYQLRDIVDEFHVERGKRK
jgi:hypothetical protein